MSVASFVNVDVVEVVGFPRGDGDETPQFRDATTEFSDRRAPGRVGHLLVREPVHQLLPEVLVVLSQVGERLYKRNLLFCITG